MRKAAFEPETIVEKVFALYEQHGDEDYIGEPVSQLEHMLQAAALAEEEGYEDDVILAAFFHDIGHLCASAGEAVSMGGFGMMEHEKLGANYLREHGFSERLASLVQSHVIAKRYLTFKYPEYYNQLSEASRATLGFQGGPMTAEEAASFEANPDAELYIRFRYWDDKAKETDVPLKDLTHLKLLAVSHLNKNN